MDELLEPGELAIVPSIAGAGGNNDFQQELREEIQALQHAKQLEYEEIEPPPADQF